MAIFALMAGLAAGPAPVFPDPIGRANDGKAQCYSPDLARKVCASLATYAMNADGGVENTATVLLSKEPVGTMTTVSPVTAVGGRLCGVMRAADLDGAKFMVSGAPADAARAAQLHTAVAGAFTAIIDHTVCVTFIADGSQFVAHTAFDGLPRPNLDQRVIWVSTADGWKVAP